MRIRFVLALALVVLFVPWAMAQEENETRLSSRPTVAVLDFEFGTVQKWWEGDWNVGKGVADMIVEELLLSGGGLRLLERSQLDAVLKEQDLANSDRADQSVGEDAQSGRLIKARYFVTGSITKFGGEDKNLGIGGLVGALAGKSYLALADVATRKTIARVEITTRIIDTTTGEIVGAVRSSGQSKRRGLLLGGGGVGNKKVAGGSIQMGSSDFRETILGEATAAAVHDAAVKLIVVLNEERGN